MADKHLNPYYSYNRDTELIENNLTRALIVSLSLLTPSARQFVLASLLDDWWVTDKPSNQTRPIDFRDASFALQSHVDAHLSKAAQRKLLLTLSTEPLADPHSFPPTDSEEPAYGGDASASTSIPDGWIFDADFTYCILVEAKVGSYPLDTGQLLAHARDWFGVGSGTAPGEVTTLARTWVDVLQALDPVVEGETGGSDQDVVIALHLMEFIGWYGYALFKGFDLRALHSPPSLRMHASALDGRVALRFDTKRLAPPPALKLTTDQMALEGRET